MPSSRRIGISGRAPTSPTLVAAREPRARWLEHRALGARAAIIDAPNGYGGSVNALADLAARQLAADLKAAPERVRTRFTDEARAARCYTVADLRALAKRTVPRPVFDYADGAAWDEVTARRNREALDAVTLHPKAL